MIPDRLPAASRPRLWRLWRSGWCVVVALVLSTGLNDRATAANPELVTPEVILAAVPFDVMVPGPLPAGMRLLAGATMTEPDDATATLVQFSEVQVPTGTSPLRLVAADGTVITQRDVSAMPGWLSVIPPIAAFALALLLRQVIVALFAAIWVGAVLVLGPSIAAIGEGLLTALSRYVLDALKNPDHAAIIVFTLMIGGLVAIISRNGGTRGVVNYVTRWAHTPERGQVSGWALGLAFFFDDYANTLIVGRTMQPITDALRISREKLAFIVDATAAPVATLALISSWIGFQVGLIGNAVEQVPSLDVAPYTLFLQSITYNFYPILMLGFVLLVAVTGRDFGPMLKAERRARAGELVAPGSGSGAPVESAFEAPAEIPIRAFNAVVPLVVLVGATASGIYLTGLAGSPPDSNLQIIIGNGDSYRGLMWGGLLGVVTAVVMTLAQRLQSLDEIIEGWLAGARTMLTAVVVLVLAWALSSVNESLHTAEYLCGLLSDVLDPRLLPTAVFLLAAVTAFATGSSWGVMGILMPLVVPLTWATLEASGLTGSMHILYGAVSAVLAGAVFGDHCSPISDTTILSSLASGCDHLDHVTTQMPYAMSVAAVAVVLGLLPSGYGVPWWLCLVMAAAAIFALHRVLSRTV